MSRFFLALGTAVVVVAIASAHRSAAAATNTSLALSRQAPDGKEVYLANCKQCHGVIGAPTKAAQGKYEHIASFVDPAFFAARSEDSIVTVLKNGKGRDMKSFKEKLSEPEMHAAAQYIRTLAKAR